MRIDKYAEEHTTIRGFWVILDRMYGNSEDYRVFKRKYCKVPKEYLEWKYAVKELQRCNIEL